MKTLKKVLGVFRWMVIVVAIIGWALAIYYVLGFEMSGEEVVFPSCPAVAAAQKNDNLEIPRARDQRNIPFDVFCELFKHGGLTNLEYQWADLGMIGGKALVLSGHVDETVLFTRYYFSVRYGEVVVLPPLRFDGEEITFLTEKNLSQLLLLAGEATLGAVILIAYLLPKKQREEIAEDLGI